MVWMDGLDVGPEGCSWTVGLSVAGPGDGEQAKDADRGWTRAAHSCRRYPTDLNISTAGYQCDVLKDSSIRNLDHDRHYMEQPSSLSGRIDHYWPESTKKNHYQALMT